MDAHSSLHDFRYPGSHYPNKDSTHQKEYGIHANRQVAECFLESTAYLSTPSLTRLLYRENRFSHDFSSSALPPYAGLGIGNLGQDEGLFPLRRIVHQMRVASIKSPAIVRNMKKRSDIVPYCDYLHGKRQPNILTSIFDLAALEPHNSRNN